MNNIKPSHVYFSQLNGIRFVAVLLVLIDHWFAETLPLPIGHLGVVIFFVLSGFLITRILFINADEIRKFVPDYVGQGEMFVANVVRDTWRSILDISVDPSKHSAFAGFVNYWGSFFTKGLLASPQYVMRMFYSVFGASGAAGGNLFRLPEGAFDLIRAVS